MLFHCVCLATNVTHLNIIISKKRGLAAAVIIIAVLVFKLKLNINSVFVFPLSNFALLKNDVKMMLKNDISPVITFKVVLFTFL